MDDTTLVVLYREALALNERFGDYAEDAAGRVSGESFGVVRNLLMNGDTMIEPSEHADQVAVLLFEAMSGLIACDVSLGHLVDAMWRVVEAKKTEIEATHYRDEHGKIRRKPF